ncbi:MAG: hypothetical protein JOS17DRAFT_507614 [Linnemannia elongata]|nr:MAG: hypothetical protein JOS17DRAFT_507614 [Linnemannia elongata]
MDCCKNGHTHNLHTQTDTRLSLTQQKQPLPHTRPHPRQLTTTLTSPLLQLKTINNRKNSYKRPLSSSTGFPPLFFFFPFSPSPSTHHHHQPAHPPPPLPRSTQPSQPVSLPPSSSLKSKSRPTHPSPSFKKPFSPLLRQVISYRPSTSSPNGHPRSKVTHSSSQTHTTSTQPITPIKWNSSPRALSDRHSLLAHIVVSTGHRHRPLVFSYRRLAHQDHPSQPASKSSPLASITKPFADRPLLSSPVNCRIQDQETNYRESNPTKSESSTRSQHSNRPSLFFHFHKKSTSFPRPAQPRNKNTLNKHTQLDPFEFSTTHTHITGPSFQARQNQLNTNNTTTQQQQ